MNDLLNVMFFTLANGLKADPAFSPKAGINITKLAEAAAEVAEDYAADEVERASAAKSNRQED
jgi:hypothetical protein